MRTCRTPIAPSPDNAENVVDPNSEALPPIITETGFIIPASARYIVEAIAIKTGSFPFEKRLDIASDATAKGDASNPSKEAGAEPVQTLIKTPIDDMHRRQHRAVPSPYNCMPFSSGIKANHYTPDVQRKQLFNLGTSPWEFQPIWMAEHEILSGPARWASGSFIGIRHRARMMMMANNVTPGSVIGSTSLHRLLDDRVRDPNLQWNVSDWAQDFMSNFPHISIPDKVACWAILWKVLRWQAFPSKETFEGVPVWCRPGLSEMFSPHMPIIICLAWPELRRYFVEQASAADWVQVVMGSISVSWPYSDESVFRSETNGALTISDAFEAWINDGSNWSLSTASARAMVGIEGRASVRQSVN